ncbi:MAG: hypothetical protein RIB80_12260 [Rhodospirillales bacterium]
MREVFLGKPWHWLLLIAVCVLTYAVGHVKLHVIHFNAFVISLLVGGFVLVMLLLKTTKPGEQVTRDPIVDTDDDGNNIPGD